MEFAFSNKVNELNFKKNHESIREKVKFKPVQIFKLLQEKNHQHLYKSLNYVHRLLKYEIKKDPALKKPASKDPSLSTIAP